MNEVQRIINARLGPESALFSITLDDRKITSVEAQAGAVACAPQEWDARGLLATSALADVHVHLDLAYTRDVVPENRSGTLLEAIRLWSAAKATMTPEDVCNRATRAINDELSWGVTAIRSHVDVASNAGTRLAQGVLAAREAATDRCDIRFVAFPQDGLIRDASAPDVLREALRMGVDHVGGIPHIERVPEDGRRHLELVFDIAAEFDRAIDVHIDESDDPASKNTEALAKLTIERGFQGRVTASHVCALSSYDEVNANRVMDMLDEARIDVVTNPAVNLHLQGRFDRYPKRRGLTRVRDLLSRGVRCAAGQDCICDPFYPLGNGNLLDQAFLLVHAEHMGSPDGIEACFEMVSSASAEMITGCASVLAPGSRADICLWDAPSAIELVRNRPRPTAVFHAGRLLADTKD